MNNLASALEQLTWIYLFIHQKPTEHLLCASPHPENLDRGDR